MTPEPTGQIVPTIQGVDIVLTRLISGTLQDVWASVTESDRTARWFGRWEGEARPGAAIRVQMAFEEGDAWSDARIESCDPPYQLGLAVGDWRLELRLAERGDRTELTFIQHRETTDGAGEIGSGWEYYLDNLLASRTDSPLPDFAEYYPSMQAYYERQAAAASALGS
jgi:uncharacterized protein YndB with AHSA1/START domain